ncbi:MAG: dimethylsulfonioproprionate lyase family protein [Pseudomonadota bacterium]
MTKPEASIARLWRVTQAFIAGHPALAAFDEGGLTGADPLPYRAETPRSLPVCAEIAAARAHAAPATRAVVEAVLAAAPALAWRQSYTAAQVGEAFLAHYGWFNLAAPDGPFVHPKRRLAFGYWAMGLHYPRHWHRPAEIYAVLAGSALFLTDGREDLRLGPGGTTTHPPDLPHAAMMDQAPLMAFGIWKGEGLTENPTLPQPVAEGVRG